MPPIPTAPRGFKVNTPATPRRDPGVRGFRVELPQVAGAPMIDARPFVQEAAAGAAIGDAIGGIGEQGFRIIQARQESFNRSKVLMAQDAMVSARRDIADKITLEAPNEPEKWEGIARKHIEEASKAWLTDDLSPDARDAIQLETQRWGVATVREVLSTSAKRQFAIEGELMEARRINAMDAGQWQEAASLIEEQRRRGLIGPDVAAKQTIQLDQYRQRKERDDLITQQQQAIAANPGGWTPPAGLDPDVENSLRGFQRETMNFRMLEARDAVAEAMAAGTIKTADDLDAVVGDRVRPAVREAMKEQWRKDQSVAVREAMRRPEVAIPHWLALKKQVNEIDATAEGADVQLFQLAVAAESLPEGEPKALLSELIKEKLSFTEPDNDTALKGYVHESIADAHSRQQLGFQYSTQTGMERDVLGLLDIRDTKKDGTAGWLYKVGLTEEEVQAIAAEPDREARVRLFQTAFEAGTAKDRENRMKKVGKFDLVDREKVARLLSAKDSTKQTVDEVARGLSAKKARDLRVMFDSWFKTQKAKGEPVTQEAVDAWFYKATNGARSAAAVPSLRAAPVPKAAPVDDQRPPFSALDIELPTEGGGPSNSLLPDMPAE